MIVVLYTHYAKA